MIDEELGGDTEFFVEEIFGFFGAEGDVAHGVETVALEAPSVAFADAPEIGEGTVVPEFLPVGLFIEFGDAGAVLVGFNVFCDDVHGDFGEVEVGTDAGGGRDAGFFQDFLEDFGGELMGGEVVVSEIGRGVDKNFVDGIDVDVFGGDVTEVDVVDAGTVADVEGHARAGDDEFVFGFLFDFVEAGAARDALSLEGWRNGETDGFVGAGFVGDDEFSL